MTAETPVVMSAAADKHVPSILQELGLAATPTGHRRVLAALAYLRESRR